MTPFTLNIRGELRLFERPQVMGILNVTDDSFYAGSRTLDGGGGDLEEARPYIEEQVRRLVDEGADMIDIGGCSSRPGSASASEEDEAPRVALGMEILRSVAPDIIVSVDTFRSSVARMAVEEYGADIVNDISAGLIDPQMITTVAALHVPFIMMHMRGTPQTMTTLTDYPRGVLAEVATELQCRIVAATQAGVADIILDPGFGFAKTVEQNYTLLAHMRDLQTLLGDRPMLAGLSRKSMIYRPLGITPAESLPGTDTLNTLALAQGAAILRVHDVAAARQVADVYSLYRAQLP